MKSSEKPYRIVLYQFGMSKCVIIMNAVVLTQISTLIIGTTLAANKISFAMAEQRVSEWAQ